MPDIENLEIEYLAPLDLDTVPNENQAHFCLSCEAPFSGLYCAACGQKNDDMRRSIFALLSEVFGSLTALENRIWRTWAALLLTPGKVAREYSNGRRTHWSSPVRVYLAMSLILFGFMNLTQTHLFSLDVNVVPREGVVKPKSELTAEDLKISASTHFLETQTSIDQRNATRDFDLLEIRLKAGLNWNIDLDGNSVTPLIEILNAPAPSQQPEDLENEDDLGDENSAVDTQNTELEELKKIIDETQLTINGSPVTQDSMRALFIDFIKNPAHVTQIFNIWLPRIMFLMMPFTMLIGAVFIRGRENALLYDHLVHAAYIHAVAFFFIFVGIVLVRIMPDLKVTQSIFILLTLYLPISLRRMFKRGWVKTIWTSYGVAALYLSLITFILICLLAFSFQSNLT